ncbi:cyclophilin-like fold protein [Roseovarius nanhaiticus]|uniref:cyclophilin-like fold protein n=1 Tax=Roseovarius nanhaiticus TaxID=573024 RepID=UPI00248F9DE9|nr:cyclophilin-like fold protein [Roseovarius nanhaiticus]
MNYLFLATLTSLTLTGAAMAQDRILITSEWGELTAELADNAASEALASMLPLTVEMRDHLRQEKTGNLPERLPEVERQLDFGAGTLGLWGGDDFVIYYTDGRVPQPGTVILGQVTGDVSIYDRPGPITVRIERAE